ncbi:hypothetical protein [Deinococcus peraridilitoris]|uniref:Uncharacterized protein n=1 Tax=Deinococcus peraridilitoris (strain DSM 19664 / LMG 22246 / CIP 109416 / KR-200) TaxID=937777 RepID=K9ZWQ5_DEIPD|nr:hypothetical protein [Deinococcus peraridilitoris]AFZ66083.1 hypothetical protein Deipe_0487 [Deinococcus peraridilitoris DSM 19664]
MTPEPWELPEEQFWAELDGAVLADEMKPRTIGEEWRLFLRLWGDAQAETIRHMAEAFASMGKIARAASACLDRLRVLADEEPPAPRAGYVHPKAAMLARPAHLSLRQQQRTLSRRPIYIPRRLM